MSARAENNVTMSYVDALKEQTHKIREYGMYIAFITLVVIFTATTNGLFLSPRNILNLVNATSYIAVLAIGMTLVIVIRHIDLSVGFLMGTLGAIAGLSLQFWGFPVYATIPFVLLLGTAAGLLTAFLVAHMRIPAFVATLAGWLLYRGTLQQATRSTGTIVIDNNVFNALSSGSIPGFGTGNFLPGWHKTTLILGLLAVIFYVWREVAKRRKTISYDFAVVPLPMFIGKLLMVSVVIGAIAWRLSMPSTTPLGELRDAQGLSWGSVILAFVVLVYAYITTRTTVGRHIFAVGGNPEAAQLNGISIKKVTYLVFASMGMLAGLSGMLYASWLHSATTTAGTGLELDVIAAAFVGGAAVSGGVGKVTSSIVGALVMASLINGMNLMTVDISIQYMVRALVLASAVIFDVATRRTKGTLVLPPWLESALTRLKGLLPRRS